MDIIAAIASDPLSLPLWAVLLFAAGMYPVGMLFNCQKKCCPQCKVCCRDNVEQVVVEYSLAGDYEATVLPNPFTASSFYSNLVVNVPFDISSGSAPYFLAVGQTSGAKTWLRSVGVGGQNRYAVKTLTNNGSVYAAGLAYDAIENATEWVHGETVSITAPWSQTFRDAQVTAWVDSSPPQSYECPNRKPKAKLAVSDPGEYGLALSGDLKVYCVSDSGSVVVDLDEKARLASDAIASDPFANPYAPAPYQCESCQVVVSRGVSHALSWDRECGANSNLYGESSSVDVTVIPFSRFPDLGNSWCGKHGFPSETTIVKQWAGIQGPASGASTRCETGATINPLAQDCAPYSAWTPKAEACNSLQTNALVTFTATSSFGSGFAGEATAPVGLAGQVSGPITAVAVTNPGSGYARPGRSQPTLSFAAAGGSGATFTYTMTKQDEWIDGYPTGNKTYTLSSMTVSGGSGYYDYAPITVSVAPPGVQTTAAALYLRTQVQAPTVTYSVAGGSGAVLNITIAANPYYPPGTYWRIASIGVVNGGSGYTTGDAVTLTFGAGTQKEPGSPWPTATVVASGGVIQSVSITNQYTNLRADTGIPQSVAFGAVGGGQFYEDGGIEAADITIDIVQRKPSAGAGAVITPVVDTDPNSPAYGQVIALTIDDGGDGYLARAWNYVYGPGGLYGGNFDRCGYGGFYFDDFLVRACPDYEVEITFQ